MTKFIWVSDEYGWYDFLDFTFFFRNKELIRLIRNDKSFLKRLREELNEIFVKYYHITTFPEELGLNYASNQEVALKCNVDEIINGLNKNISFPVSMICNINGTSEILLIKLRYNPQGEKLICIEEINENAVKLSEMLNKKSKLKEEQGQILEKKRII